MHGPSLVVDPLAYRWRHPDWRGRPWHETVLYEAACRPARRLRRRRARTARLAALGVTAVELMPISEFPGRRNWGYDGVLPFAPERSYGTPGRSEGADRCRARSRPDDLSRRRLQSLRAGRELSRALRARHLPRRRRHAVGSGASISAAARSAGSSPRTRFTGCSNTASTACASTPFTPSPMRTGSTRWPPRCARAVEPGRHVHLVLEHDDNAAAHLRRDFDAQWNDDAHHVLHVLLTGERDGYYADYADRPAEQLARCLGEGFVYQGEPSAYRERQAARHAERRSCRRPPSCCSCRTTTRSATARSATG